MSDKTNARSQDRTPYRGPVWIQPADGASLVGDVRNLSQGGMFVNVVPTPPLGQEIVCELPGYRAVRGRVVWISSPSELADHGVGIEFVDLTERPTPILAMPSTTYAGSSSLPMGVNASVGLSSEASFENTFTFSSGLN